MMEQKLKYIAYYRVSTKKQGESGLGLDAQKAVVEYYAKANNAEIIAEFIETKSGKTMQDREQLQKAMSLTKVTPGAILVVAKLDRLSRDVENTFSILRELNQRVKAFNLPNMDPLTISIMAGFAQLEREQISIRTQAALAQKKKQGTKLGKPENLTNKHRALARKILSEKTKEHRQDITRVSIAKNLRNEGKSYEEIAEALNKIGLTTYHGKPYTRQTARKIIYSQM